jgi:hypothetical protein
MSNRKIYCEVIEGVVYDDRCLFKLSKIIEGNKTCKDCVLHEIEKNKSSRIEKTDMKKRKRGKVKRKR